MTKYGYMRKRDSITTIKQMKLFISESCDEVYIEEKSYLVDLELSNLIRCLKAGDVLVVECFSAFGKADTELQELFAFFNQNEIRLINLSEEVDSNERYSLFQLTEILFKVNQKTNRLLAKEGGGRGHKQRQSIGRPMLEQEKIDEIKYLHKSERLSMRSIATKCNVSLGTVHKYTRVNN